MSLLKGPATIKRVRLTTEKPGFFGSDQLERLFATCMQIRNPAVEHGIQSGWVTGQHVYDVTFTPEKNIINDLLVFALCIEGNHIPKSKLDGYIAIELAALLKHRDTDVITKQMRQESRENAIQRLSMEANDGRYLRRRMIELAWDQRQNELWIATGSANDIDRAMNAFVGTFGGTVDPVDVETTAKSISQSLGVFTQAELEQCSLSAFTAMNPDEPAWSKRKRFIGNEFLMWLWYQCEEECAEFLLADNSSVVVMMSGKLVLECPRGITGHETITHEGPTRLPEAMRAIQSGKLPRKAGLTLSRHSNLYTFVLDAEQWVISATKVTASPHDEERLARPILEQRIELIRSMHESLDLLFEEFCSHRFSPAWSTDLARMQRWLERETHREQT